IVERSGRASRNAGEIFQCSAQRIFVRAWVLRELESSAIDRAWRIGSLEISRRLRTRCFDAMDRLGRIVRPSMRWYSMAGRMAVSRVRSSSAHCEGTVKERSYLPCSGPCVKPRTSGAVLRYWTMEMRNLVTVETEGFLQGAKSPKFGVACVRAKARTC